MQLSAARSRGLLLCALAATMTQIVRVADAASVVIRNGAVNIIDDASYSSDVVYVRNVGCPPLWPLGSPGASCPVPAQRTIVEFIGASVAWSTSYDSSTIIVRGASSSILESHDSSAITVIDVWTSDLYSRDSSTIDMIGGIVDESVIASQTSTITIRGGVLGRNGVSAQDSSVIAISGGRLLPGSGMIWAEDNSSVHFVGDDFKVDGVPVPYGDLTAPSGTLTGTLASGDPIDSGFDQVDNGTVTLTAALPAAAARPVRLCDSTLPSPPAGKGLIFITHGWLPPVFVDDSWIDTMANKIRSQVDAQNWEVFA